MASLRTERSDHNNPDNGADQPPAGQSRHLVQSTSDPTTMSLDLDTSSNSGMPPVTFPFRKLPLELQMTIYEHALPRPEHTYARIDPLLDVPLGAVPLIIHIRKHDFLYFLNHSALAARAYNLHHIGLEIQRIVYGPEPRRTYWHTRQFWGPVIDLHRPFLVQLSDMRMVCGDFSTTRLYSPRLRYLALAVEEQDGYQHGDIPLFEAFPSLRGLTIVIGGTKSALEPDAAFFDVDEDFEDAQLLTDTFGDTRDPLYGDRWRARRKARLRERFCRFGLRLRRDFRVHSRSSAAWGAVKFRVTFIGGRSTRRDDMLFFPGVNCYVPCLEDGSIVGKYEGLKRLFGVE